MSIRPAALAGRAGATLALLGFAGLAIISGLDRLSLPSPASRLIPAALRAQSARSAASLAIARREPEPAVASARDAVAADPMNPASSAVLGSAYLLAGDGGAAEQAFRVAARFGWREPATQFYWYQAALQSGDLPRAVDRADALLRTRKGAAEAEEVLTPLESTPAGRAALVARMADRPAWLTDYLKLDEADAAALARRTQVLAELGAAGTSLGCDTVTPFVQAALDRGARRQVERVWTAHCPGASLDAGLADGGFEHFGGSAPSPFGWRSQLSGDVTMRVVDKSGGGHAVELRNSAPLSRLVLTQAIAVPAGTYRLTGQVAPGRLAGSVGCDAAPLLPSRSDGDMGAGGQVLHVPQCAALELGLWLRPGADAAQVDDVVLEKIG